MALTYLKGPAGTGKTSRAIQQLQTWLQDGVPPHNIMIMLPQRTLGGVYHLALSQSEVPNAFDVESVTYGGIAQRALTLYWTLIAPKAIPNWDGRDPQYLTIETAQYHMAQFVDPVLEAGYFDSVNLDRARLIAQILGNMSAAAGNGFTLGEIEGRLVTTWNGHSSRIPVFQTAVQIAKDYREHCIQNALLDFSLQIELYRRYVLHEEHYINQLTSTYQYLICDNLEENYAVGLDFVDLLASSPQFQDGLLIYDDDAGYRVFLSADPDYAAKLEENCDHVEAFTASQVQSEPMQNLTAALQATLTEDETMPDVPAESPQHPSQAFDISFNTFYPQMVDWISDTIIDLVVVQGVSPREIVIIAPFLGDSLRFSLFNRLEKADIPYVSHRPSRAVRDEPVSRALLTLMKLAYSQWHPAPPRIDIALMLGTIITELDPIRAELLTQIVYRPNQETLTSFDEILPSVQSRITYRIGEKYEKLRLWLLDFQEIAPQTPPDHCLMRLFDLASQSDYGLHHDLEAGRILSELIESAKMFREVIAPEGVENWTDFTTEYLTLVGEGLLAATHYTSWQDENKDAVLISPAYTYLMRNRFVDYQIWVDIGSNAWFERIEQPLTHPYVLHRNYPPGLKWTDELEVASQEDMLRRLILGLVRRCRQKIYLSISDLGEQGFEQRGVLLKIFNRIMQAYQTPDSDTEDNESEDDEQ